MEKYGLLGEKYILRIKRFFNIKKYSLSMSIKNFNNHSHLFINLSIHKSTTEKEIKNILTANKDWINKNALELESRFNKKLQNEQNLIVDYIKNNKNHLVIFNESYEIKDLNKNKLIEILENKSLELLRKYSKLMNLAFNKLHIKAVKSYLGKCDNKNNITISLSLALASKDMLQYLIIHELAHIKHPNHSLQFWKLVETFCPNYKIIERELKNINTSNIMLLEHYKLT